MNLHNVMKLKSQTKKRIGRGLGSGKGKTSARGQKGQKARGKVPQGFTGETLTLYRKLPFKRGLGNRKVSIKPAVVDVAKLASYKAKSEVTLESLIENKLVTPKQATKQGVKLVGKGPLEVALTVKVPASKYAAEVITKAGGTLEG